MPAEALFYSDPLFDASPEEWLDENGKEGRYVSLRCVYLAIPRGGSGGGSCDVVWL
jgi:hypothetical protein